MLDPVTDINNNPAWGGMYRNYMFANIGRTSVNANQLSDQYAGINFGLGDKKNLNLGLVLNKREDAFDAFANELPTTNGGYAFNGYGLSSPIVPLKVLFGYSSSNINFGIAPYYAAWSTDSNNVSGTVNTDQKWSSSSMGTQLGLLYKMNTDWIEGAIDFKLNKFSYEGTSSAPSSYKTENEGGMQLGVMLRGWFNVEKNAKIKLVPYLGFSMFSWNGKITSSPVAYVDLLPKYSYMNLNAGLGINMPILEKGTLATGLSFAYNSFNVKREDITAYEDTYSSFTLPKFNVAAEWFFTEWLSGRLGYSRAVISNKNDGKSTAGTTATTWTYKISTASDADQTITTGLGMHFDRFSFDGMIGERFFKQGSYLISGRTDDLYGVISASYNFNR
jgi:hypothetical protein